MCTVSYNLNGQMKRHCSDQTFETSVPSVNRTNVNVGVTVVGTTKCHP